MKTIERKIITLPSCPKCGSRNYHFDDSTGTPMYCAECGINSSHISSKDVSKCADAHFERIQARMNDGIPACPDCKSQIWKYALGTNSEPQITHCGACGKNYPHTHIREVAIKIISLQTGQSEEDVLRGDKILITIKPNSLSVASGSSEIPQENRFTVAETLVSEPMTLNPVFEDETEDVDTEAKASATKENLLTKEEMDSIQEAVDDQNYMDEVRRADIDAEEEYEFSEKDDVKDDLLE